ncbi:hypothetical protein BH24ACT23_BH24ACT23_03670 [soil metagenome]
MGGLADSGLVMRLTRSRGWIGLVGFLLVGIVALNVYALSLNANSSKTAGTSDELRRENSALRAQIADGLSNERLQNVAARLGLVLPEAGATLLLRPGSDDAAAAARRLKRGDVILGEVAPTPVVPLPAVAPDPIAVPTTDPAPDPAGDLTAAVPAAPADADGATGMPTAVAGGGVTP